MAAAATVLGAAAVLATLIAVADRGFDFTDEAFYLLSMQAPAAYRMTSTLFGYALRPAYLLLGGDIAGLRVFGVVVLATLGAAAGGLCLTSLRRQAGMPGASAKAAIIASAAAVPAMYYGFWAPTPSYNWLVLAAGLLLLPSIVLLADREQRATIPAALAALAGLVAVLAKPTTAAAYAAIFLAATLVLVREPRRLAIQLGLAFGFTGAGLAALALWLPVETIWMQTRGYMEMHGAAPPAGRGPTADLISFLGHPRGWPFVAGVVAAGLAAGAQSWRGRARRWIMVLAVTAVIGAAGLIIGFPVFPALGPGMWAIAVAAIALALLAGVDRRIAVALGLATLLPFAAAVGTTNDTVSQTSFHAGIFGIVALLAAAATGRQGAVLAAALVLVLFTAGAVWKGLARPYRLAAPVWRQTEPVEVGARGERLKLDPRTAAFVRSLRESGGKGFCPGAPLVDLSGEMPGVAVILGGTTPGLPWLFGGYPFSEKLAAWALAAVDRDARARAWLVVGEGRIAFSPTFIATLGFAWPSNYDLIFSEPHPLYDTPVRLYRPLSVEAPC